MLSLVSHEVVFASCSIRTVIAREFLVEMCCFHVAVQVEGRRKSFAALVANHFFNFLMSAQETLECEFASVCRNLFEFPSVGRAAWRGRLAEYRLRGT